jgi:hypothetical protein
MELDDSTSGGTSRLENVDNQLNNGDEAAGSILERLMRSTSQAGAG